MSSLFASKALRVVSPLVALTKPQSRNLFRRSFFDPSFRSLINDMEQMFNSVYRDVGRALPISLPHVTSAGVEESPKYRLNIDVSGFRPEDIKLSLKDRILSIQAKMDRKSDDGSRYYQEVTREYLLPESLKIDDLKSIYSDDGILRIEAPLPEAEKPRELPIERAEPKKELEDK